MFNTEIKKVVRDIFVVCLILSSLLFLWRFAVASEHLRTFNYLDPEIRLEVMKNLFPSMPIVGIPEEYMELYSLRCEVISKEKGYPGTMFPSAINIEGAVLCAPSIEIMKQDENHGYKKLCKIMGMEYVAMPKPESVTCEKKIQEPIREDNSKVTIH